MDAPLLHQALLWWHLAAFAIAFAAVVRADLGLLRARRFDAERLAATARLVTLALACLWASGLGLVALDAGWSPAAWLARPKLAAKLAVVSVLTLNGLALHGLAFPRLRRADAAHVTLPVLLGAVSSASWLYAACVGAARELSPMPGFGTFMLVYLGTLGAAAGVALAVVRPRLARMLARGAAPIGLAPVERIERDGLAPQRAP